MRKLWVGLGVLVALALALTVAQSQKTKTQMNTEINTNFPDNTTGLITPLITRTTTQDMVASWIDWVTCSGNGANGVPTWNNGLATYQCQSFPWSVAQGGTGLTAGTNGGIPCYTGATTLASSGALPLRGIVYGGGAGGCVAATTQGALDNVLMGNGTSPPAF